MENRARPKRSLTCPRCQEPVRIPLYWALGLEGVFRCRNCRFPFKTGYKTGAFLSGLALCLSMASIQLLVYLFSSYSLPFFIWLLIPHWLYLAYRMRKSYLKVKCRRDLRKMLRSSAEKRSEFPRHEAAYRNDFDEFSSDPNENDSPERVYMDDGKKVFEWDYSENAEEKFTVRDPTSISKSELPPDTPFDRGRKPE